MLETVTDLTRTNIGNLNLQEPLPETPVMFDPRKEVPLELRADIKTQLIKTFSEKNWDPFSRLCFYTRVLFPEDLKPEFSEVGKDPSFANFLKNYKERDLFSYLEYAMKLKIGLGLSNLDVRFYQSDWEEMVSSIKAMTANLTNRGGFQEYKDMLVYARVMHSTDYGHLTTDSRMKSWILQIIDFNQQRSRLPEYLRAIEFLRQAFNFRILFPEDDRSEFDNPENWRTLKEDWELSKTKVQASQLATYLTIFSADQLEMTENGLNLVLRKPQQNILTQSIPQLPETRKF